MPRVSGSVSVPANSTSLNVVAGSSNEYPKVPSLVKYYAAASATGIAAEARSGNDVLLENLGTNNISFANRFPIDPDDLATKDVAMPLDRQIFKFTNLTGGALTVNWAIDIIPLRR